MPTRRKRKPSGLPARPCNRCQEPFFPTGKFNRRCPKCDAAIGKLGRLELGVLNTNPGWKTKGANE